jgi:excisionase family DNA binding protein
MVKVGDEVTRRGAGGYVVPLDSSHDIVMYVGETPPDDRDRVRGVILADSADAEVVADRLRNVAEVSARLDRIRDRLQLDLEQVLEAFEDVAARLAGPSGSTEPFGQLTEHDQTSLREAGMLRSVPQAALQRASITGALRFAEMRARSLTVKEAAARLGVTGGRVRQRLSERTLYGFQTRRGWRLPDFQFGPEPEGTLPNLEQVLPQLPREIHPLTVEGFFTKPQADLVVGHEPVSVTEWLGSGGDAAAVAEIASDLQRSS